MKDYASMSDFEINCRVHAEVMEISGLDSFKAKDYCNNPADAWPIIVDNKIAIANFTDGNSASWSTKWGMVSNFYSEGENPLRCAMIVFLMMKEGDK